MKQSIFLFLIIAALFSCKSDSSNKSYVKSGSDQKKNNEKQIDVQQLFYTILNQCDQAELLIDINGAALTSDTQTKSQILSYATYISNESAPKFHCPNNGNLLFRQGDKIIAEAELFIEPSCQHIKLKVGNKVYDQKISNEGKNYFKQFSDMLIQQKEDAVKNR